MMKWEEMRKILKEDASYSTMFRLLKGYGDEVCAELLRADGSVLSMTYAEAVKAAYAAAGNLQKNPAFSVGDRVGLMYENTMDWPTFFWAILMSGGIPLLMNPASGAALASSILAEAEASCYISAKPVEGASAEWIEAASLLVPGKPGNENWSDTVALCTSGTTGASRIFLYSARAVANQLLSFQDARLDNPEYPYSDELPNKVLAFLPFYHVFGFSVVYLLYTIAGKSLVYIRDKSPKTVLEACRALHVTNLYCVPMFFNALAAGLAKKLPVPVEALPEAQKAAIRGQLLGNDIRVMITGGGHAPLETLRLMNGIGYPLYNGFGMTECGVISVETSTDPAQRAKGSIGKIFSDTAHKVEPAGTGELFLRGDTLFTASMAEGKTVPRDPEAWFATGDLVREASDGVYITGRVKDVIVNASGENVYPDELEDEFSALPGVGRVCILGLKNGNYEDISLVAEPLEGSDHEALAEAVRRVNEKLPANEQVKRLILSGEPLPVSGSLKVMRQALKKALEAGSGKFTPVTLYGEEPAEAEVEAFEGDPEELARLMAAIREIIAGNFEVEADSFGDRDNFVNMLGGDSLMMAGALLDMQDTFDIHIPDEVTPNMVDLEHTARIVYDIIHS